jgi:hypothetical protein
MTNLKKKTRTRNYEPREIHKRGARLKDEIYTDMYI